MPKKRESSERESQLATGWTVAGEKPAQAATSVAQESQLDSKLLADADHLSAAEVADLAVRRGEVSNLALVLYGVFGGIYLLYTVAWFFIAQYFSATNEITASTSGIIGGVLQYALFWVSALAPAAWFVSVIALSRDRKVWVLPLGLLVGLIALFPLPLFVVGSVS